MFDKLDKIFDTVIFHKKLTPEEAARITEANNLDELFFNLKMFNNEPSYFFKQFNSRERERLIKMINRIDIERHILNSKKYNEWEKRTAQLWYLKYIDYINQEHTSLRDLLVTTSPEKIYILNLLRDIKALDLGKVDSDFNGQAKIMGFLFDLENDRFYRNYLERERIVSRLKIKHLERIKSKFDGLDCFEEISEIIDTDIKKKKRKK